MTHFFIALQAAAGQKVLRRRHDVKLGIGGPGVVRRDRFGVWGLGEFCVLAFSAVGLGVAGGGDGYMHE